MSTRWSNEQLEQVRVLVAAGKSAREVAAIVGASRAGVQRAVAKYQLGPWKTLIGAPPRPRKPAPADFRQRWQSSNVPALQIHYGVSREIVSNWVAECGLRRTQSSVPVARRSNGEETVDDTATPCQQLLRAHLITGKHWITDPAQFASVCESVGLTA
jgi:hypothetical protein